MSAKLDFFSCLFCLQRSYSRGGVGGCDQLQQKRRQKHQWPARVHCGDPRTHPGRDLSHLQWCGILDTFKLLRFCVCTVISTSLVYLSCNKWSITCKTLLWCILVIRHAKSYFKQLYIQEFKPFQNIFQLKDSKVVKKADTVSKHNSIYQEIMFEKFTPGCVVIFRWVNLGMD